MLGRRFPGVLAQGDSVQAHRHGYCPTCPELTEGTACGDDRHRLHGYAGLRNGSLMPCSRFAPRQELQPKFAVRRSSFL
ncbi:hypothetical protein [Streptomyces microflavus]|uniref:hypothetical protein n=1 Tax=Streptomyces microflavus TaxID=1919 RepID=UPI003F4C569B